MMQNLALTLSIGIPVLIIVFGLLFWQSGKREDRGFEWEAGELPAIAHPAHSFTDPLSEIELSPPTLFDQMAAMHQVRLDWRPPDFTQEWHAIGAMLHELGDTQVMEKVTV